MGKPQQPYDPFCENGTDKSATVSENSDDNEIVYSDASSTMETTPRLAYPDVMLDGSPAKIGNKYTTFICGLKKRLDSKKLTAGLKK